MKKVLLFCLLFLVKCFVNAQFIKKTVKPTKDSSLPQNVLQTKVGQLTNIDFKIKNIGETNPFDQDFTAELKSDSGKILLVQGFYNGSNTFRLRFTPNQVGNYILSTKSSLLELNGQTKSIKVDANPVFEGAVEVSPQNKNKFQYQNGKPYHALAFELDWLFALDYATSPQLPKTKQLIDSIANYGFNQIVMNVYAYDVGWKVADNVPANYQYKQPNYSVFEGDNANPNFEKLNLKLFQHLDQVVAYLHEKGLVAHVMIYVWNKKVTWPAMYSAADNRYFDYVIKRYQAYPNIIWDISKEALDYGRCDIPYINERIERLRKLDQYKRLVTVHDYEYCSREPNKVDFISIQNWRNDLYSTSIQALQRHTDKPVMNIEHGGYEKGPYLSFEGNYTSPEVCLIRNYECAFAGLYSSYYWQNTAWNIVVFDPLNPKNTFTKPRFDYYKHFQNFLTKHPFDTLKAYAPKLTTNGRIEKDNLSSSGYALTNDLDQYLYLVPGTNSQINIVTPKPASGKLETQWFNIFTGEYTKPETSDWWNWKGFSCPWPGQYAVLIVKSVE
jgi:hypothetical protein